jgi:hypothetical protein
MIFAMKSSGARALLHLHRGTAAATGRLREGGNSSAHAAFIHGCFALTLHCSRCHRAALSAPAAARPSRRCRCFRCRCSCCRRPCACAPDTAQYAPALRQLQPLQRPQRRQLLQPRRARAAPAHTVTRHTATASRVWGGMCSAHHVSRPLDVEQQVPALYRHAASRARLVQRTRTHAWLAATSSHVTDDTAGEVRSGAAAHARAAAAHLECR